MDRNDVLVRYQFEQLSHVTRIFKERQKRNSYSFFYSTYFFITFQFIGQNKYCFITFCKINNKSNQQNFIFLCTFQWFRMKLLTTGHGHWVSMYMCICLKKKKSKREGCTYMYIHICDLIDDNRISLSLSLAFFSLSR